MISQKTFQLSWMLIETRQTIEVNRRAKELLYIALMQYDVKDHERDYSQ